MKSYRFPLLRLAVAAVLVVLAQSLVLAQQPTAPVQIIGQYQAGKVVLRWVPASPETWEELNEKGYVLERLQIPGTAAELAKRRFTALTLQPIKPAPAAAWEKITETNDHAAAAYMALYAERMPSLKPDLLSQIKSQADQRDNAYFVAMTAANLSAPTAELLGLRYEDENLPKGERYLYRIYPAARLETAPTLGDTAMVLVTTDEAENPVPVGLGTTSDEKKVRLQWPYILNKANFFAYYVERADSPNGPFTRLTAAPLLRLVNDELGAEQDKQHFYDSVGVNYRPFYYRLVGTTPYGTESRPSEVVMGMGRDMTPPTAPIILNAEPFEATKAKVTWKKPVRESDFRGFTVGRSPFAEGPFQPLHDKPLPPGATEFVDPNPVLGGTNFYAVTALDTAGNGSQSMSAYALFPDTFPPAAPVGLRGTVDTLGVVRLTWSPNREPDVQGYAIYWSNADDHSFIMINNGPVRDTMFTDTITLSTLTEEVFYRVAAIDNGFGFSELSGILKLKRPDRVPPSSGLISNYLASEKQVKISWVPSSSHDLASQELWRKQPGEDWKLLRKFARTDTTFTDENLRPGGEYEYALVAQDDDGLRSERSFPLGVRLPAASNLPGVDDLKLAFDKEKKTLNLSWKYADAGRYRFVIYRSTASVGGLMTYESVSGALQFSDVWLPETGEYGYAVRVVDEAGNESGLSKTAKTTVGE